MIRHIVLIRAGRADAPLDAILDALVTLARGLPGVGSAMAGPSDSPEDLERGYTHGLCIDFVARDALAHYAQHPEHRTLGARLADVAEGGIDGILVMDLVVD